MGNAFEADINHSPLLRPLYIWGWFRRIASYPGHIFLNEGL